MAKTNKARVPEPETECEECIIEAPKLEEKVCKVVRYDPNTGVLGFMFDDIPCQFNVPKGLKLGPEVTIKYTGTIDGHIEFSL